MLNAIAQHDAGKRTIVDGPTIAAWIQFLLTATAANNQHPAVQVRCPSSVDVTGAKHALRIVSIQGHDVRREIFVDPVKGVDSRTLDVPVDLATVQHETQDDRNRRLQQSGLKADGVVHCNAGLLVVTPPSTFYCDAFGGGKPYKVEVRVADTTGMLNWHFISGDTAPSPAPAASPRYLFSAFAVDCNAERLIAFLNDQGCRLALPEKTAVMHSSFLEPDGQGWSQLAQLGIAFVLSALIGLEREYRQKSAGFRTYTVVGLAAALIMLVSKYGFTDVLQADRIVLDLWRVAAQIVTGIGFIGGGVIFMRRDLVRGLTTAAIVWLTAAVGMACAPDSQYSPWPLREGISLLYSGSQRSHAVFPELHTTPLSYS